MSQFQRFCRYVLVLMVLVLLGGCAVASTTTATTTAPRPDYLSDNVPAGFKVWTKYIPEDFYRIDYSNISYVPSTGIFCFDYQIQIVAAHLDGFSLQIILPNTFNQRYRTIASDNISTGRVFVGSYCSMRLLNDEDYDIRIYGTTANQEYVSSSGFNVFAFSTPAEEPQAYTGYTVETYGTQDRYEWVVFDPYRTIDQLTLRVTRASTNEVIYEQVVFITPESYYCWQGSCVIFSYQKDAIPTEVGVDYFIELFVTGYNGIEYLEDYPLYIRLRNYIE